jgi:hypothetical protein
MSTSFPGKPWERVLMGKVPENIAYLWAKVEYKKLRSRVLCITSE